MLVSLLGFRFRRFPLIRSRFNWPRIELPKKLHRLLRTRALVSNLSQTPRSPKESFQALASLTLGHQCSPAFAASTGLSLFRFPLSLAANRSGSGISAPYQSVATAGFTRTSVTRASLSCSPPRGFASLGLGLRFSLSLTPPPSLALGRCRIPTNA
jgi:hypothetical protein